MKPANQKTNNADVHKEKGKIQGKEKIAKEGKKKVVSKTADLKMAKGKRQMVDVRGKKLGGKNQELKRNNEIKKEVKDNTENQYLKNLFTKWKRLFKKNRVKSKNPRHNSAMKAGQERGTKQRFYQKRKFWVIASPATLILIIVLFFVWINVAYSAEILPGVQIDGIKINGKTKEEATDILRSMVGDYLKEKTNLKYEDKTYEPTFEELGAEINYEGTVNAAFEIGRDNNWSLRLWDQTLSLFGQKHQIVLSSFDEKKLDDYFFKNAKKTVSKVKNATLSFDGEKIIKVKERQGKHFNNELLGSQLSVAIGQLNEATAELEMVKIVPKLTTKDIIQTQKEAQAVLDRGMTLKSSDRSFVVAKSKLGSWLTFKAVKPESIQEQSDDNILADPDKLVVTAGEDSKKPTVVLSIKLNQENTKKYLESIVTDVDRTPTNVKLSYSGGKLKVAEASHTGSSVEIGKTILDIEEAIRDKQTVVKIVMKTANPQITEENLTKLGIKELIAQGTSSFAGSPSNRIHNIGVGAAAINGTIVAPGDIFSVNNALGEVTSAAGYLPELVIKGNKIVPENGGGLCQVSTTAFRAALNAGCEIIERRNHRFRVMYYEPAGTDATIYSPSPDFRFKNDTGKHILIQTSISGSTLTFDFYGTKGNRTVKIDGPHISAGASPGAAEEIVDNSLAPGARVLVEGSFSGATAVLYQYVYEAGKQVRKDTFSSTYVPQAAVYKVGPS